MITERTPMTPRTHRPTGSNALLQKGDTSALLSLSGLMRAHVRLRQALRAVGPAMPRQRPHEALRAALGAGLALSLSGGLPVVLSAWRGGGSEEHTSQLQSLMRTS